MAEEYVQEVSLKKEVEEVVALKDALCNQYTIMKNLYSELEDESEASASAATEALSMILRLQREKAVEKMEACQYKRMSEEKMRHAEECLSILKEVTQQKEMEITTLQYQLQAYKQKLAGLGVNLPDITELAIYDNQFISGSSNALWDKASPHGKLKRNISLPSLGSEQLSLDQMDVHKREDSTVPSRRQSIWRKISEKYDECGMQDLYYESEQLAMVDNFEKRRDLVVGGKKAIEITSEMPSSIASALGSKSVHDIFEVPESLISCGNLCIENDWLKYWAFMNSYHKNKLRTQSKNHGSTFATPTRGNSLDLCPYGETGTSQVDFEQLKVRLKQLEDEHVVMQKDTERGKEQMKLLRDIFKQLNTIESHVKIPTVMTEQRGPQENSKVVSVMEAVLSFSI